MLHHEDDGDHGRGISRRHAPERMIVVGPSPMAPLLSVAPLVSIALDTGGTDEFTFTTAGGFACFWGLCPYEQGKIAVAS